MNRVVVRKYWEERIYNITDVCVVDEDNEIIEAETVSDELIECVESGDIEMYTPTKEYKEKHPYLIDDINRFTEEHKELLNQ